MSEKTTTISPSGNSLGGSLYELWQNPGVLRALTLRDIRVRYAQTILGLGWGLVQPVLGLAAVFILFFKLAGVDSGSTPYLVFALSGLVIWNYFYYLTTQSAAGLVHMQAMIRKIYFPRLSIPVSKVMVGLIDLAIGLLLLSGVLLYYHIDFSGIWMIIPTVLLTAAAGLGVGLIISAVSLRYRDLQQILPFLLQVHFFLTPIAYPASLMDKFLTQETIWVAYLNPLTGILDLWRQSLFDSPASPYSWISALISLSLLTVGVVFFTRIERKMADLV